MSATADIPLDLATLRERLAAKDAPSYWRSLEEVAETEAFRSFLHNEFPQLAAAEAPNRRSVLKLMAAALGLSGLAACEKAEEIVPYVQQPEDSAAGRALHYATALPIDGFGHGVIVTSHEGRPTKVEGNPDHPASLGATDAILQSACLSLYDPTRSRTPLKGGQPASWDDFLGEVSEWRSGLAAGGGAGLALLYGATTSPTLAWQIERLRSAYPKMQTFRHDPLAGGGEEAALTEIFGKRMRPLSHIQRADVVVSFDADILGDGPQRLANARAFAGRRILRDGASGMCRLYAFESTPTITGASADHRFPLRATSMEATARALAAELGAGSPGGTAASREIHAIAADLIAARGAALIVAGRHLPPTVHRLVHAMNAALGADGRTIEYIAAPDHPGDSDGDLHALAQAISTKTVDTLLVLGGDPVYTAPGDVAFRDALMAVPRTIHLGSHGNRTAAACGWHLPESHALESWSDLRSFDGTAAIVQPLIRPLHNSRTAHEIVAAFLGEFDRSARDIVRGFWRDRGGLDDAAWSRALQTGIVGGSRTPPEPAAGAVLHPTAGDAPPETVGLELRLLPDPWLRAGENAANIWLQELPRPLSKIVWGNAVLIAPATAERLGLQSGDEVKLAGDGRAVTAPLWIEPGQPEDALTLSLGFGQAIGITDQTGVDGADTTVGVDAYPLRRSGAPWILTGITLTATGERARIVTLQHHHSMEGRDIIRHATLAEYLGDKALLHGEQPGSSVHPDWPYKQEAWGMVIDQTACIGCMACVAACQAENNTPSVGPDECERGHEMHWLRVDRYYSGPADDPSVFFQPVPCMQCEKAPCEVVCPVNATVHTHDGLNAQVYNRCIGTRYCSQNCPYKVRRFNFLQHQDFRDGAASPFAPLMNPDVSVRSRGVMEKCTYCVQRISKARIGAEIEGREIRDGEIVTACQQACPTQAIVFGDLNQKESAVRRLRDHPLNYTLLAELNTRPRTTYLGRIGNPNPRLASADEETEGG